MPKKILVVDDSRIAQLQLQKILADSDYEVVGCCQSGEEALELYDKLSPDLVTMDILMPGMDGLEAARLLLQMAAHRFAREVLAFQRLHFVMVGIGCFDLLLIQRLLPKALTLE